MSEAREGRDIEWNRLIAEVAPAKDVEIARLLPEIERARKAGVSHSKILEQLAASGISLSYNHYKKALGRARAKVARAARKGGAGDVHMPDEPVSNPDKALQSLAAGPELEPSKNEVGSNTTAQPVIPRIPIVASGSMKKFNFAEHRDKTPEW